MQSVALRLIVEREREIQAFKPEEYWNLTAELQDQPKKHSPFKALLEKKGTKKYKPASAEETEKVDVYKRQEESSITAEQKQTEEAFQLYESYHCSRKKSAREAFGLFPGVYHPVDVYKRQSDDRL